MNAIRNALAGLALTLSTNATVAAENEPMFDEGDLPEVTAKGGGAPTVVFFIMDTVRSMSTSMCGYERPTTPFLDRFVKRPGVSHACQAYSAATWTVPSHASYFTGTRVPEHESDSMGHTFGADMPVLAEVMAEQGYQTVMFSANPTLSEESGLQRGFEFVRVANNLRELRGNEVPKTIRKIVSDRIDPNKPLFLFVNLLDAHDPYPPVPDGVGWVPKQDRVDIDVFEENQNDKYHQYVRGEMPPGKAKEYLKSIRNGYDYGIWMADRETNQVMRVLQREGWLENGYRFVLTSDHGEYLGEHHLLRHGCYTWEPVVRVPFVYYDSTASKPIPFKEPFSAINAYALTSTGALPAEPIVPNSFSKRREFDVKVGADMAAIWPSRSEKLVWLFDEYWRFDLATDPNEMGHNRLGEHPLRALIEQYAAEHAAHLERIRTKEKDPERVKELQALGYIE